MPTNPNCFTIEDDCLLLCYTLHCAFNCQKLDAFTRKIFAVLEWLYNSNMITNSICCNLIAQSMVLHHIDPGVISMYRHQAF